MVTVKVMGTWMVTVEVTGTRMVDGDSGSDRGADGGNDGGADNELQHGRTRLGLLSPLNNDARKYYQVQRAGLPVYENIFESCQYVV